MKQEYSYGTVSNQPVPEKSINLHEIPDLGFTWALYWKCAHTSEGQRAQYCFVFKDPKRASLIAALPRDKRRAVMNALANLARFSGQYDYWHWIARNAGLKYEKRPAIEVALKMLNSNLQDVEDWLVKALQVLPAKHSTALAFIAVTGLRPGEGCVSAALISDLAEQGRLTDYYNEKMRMLEHFRFPKLFLRRSKNCYISFVPRSMLDRVVEIRPRASRIAVIRALDQRGMNARIRDLRHLYATRLRESVPSEVIDLVQGRIGESVFLRYYYESFLEKIREKMLAVVDPFAEKLLAIST